MTSEVGVLFADLRDFTAQSETMSPEQATAVLRRFYACAEHVLFPEALIDKVIGDEVMALYLPIVVRPKSRGSIGDDDRRHVAAVMLEHARELLEHHPPRRGRRSSSPIDPSLNFGRTTIGRYSAMTSSPITLSISASGNKTCSAHA